MIRHSFSIKYQRLYFIFILFFWPCHKVCKILVPQSGIEPVLPATAVEEQGPNHWTTREFPNNCTLNDKFSPLFHSTI